MAPDHYQDHEPTTTTTLQPHLATWPWHLRRRLRRRRKVQTVRLGGQKPRRRVLRGLVRVFRRMRVRWLKLQYLRLLKRLKEHYRNVVKDMIEGAATIETFQQRLFMESTFAIPVGFNLSTYPSRCGSDYNRTIFM
ncbi:uncharacterized protein LOC130746448 [Lotus japonicus]|uniref:uncharacterized protein LOC130746448 n=1 Tax=Lotus japonicus TaxID=34305 RepID=UPI00258F98E5|nr:uncharacterized protein LOC130746448 [Lotus japonicus]